MSGTGKVNIMNRALLLLASAVLLSACNKGVELKNASVEDVAEATKDAHFITPGQWTTTSEILAVELEGLPAEAKRMGETMSRSMVGRKNNFESCVSEADSKKPAANLFAGGGKGSCAYEKFSMSGGKVDAVMNCTSPSGPGKMTMTMNGDYSDDAYSINVAMKMPGSPGMPGSGMTMKARNSGKRTGECKKG